MAVKRGFRGDNVIYRRSNGETMAVILSGGQGDAPGTVPTGAQFGTGGTLTAATYNYKYSYTKDGVESPASAASANIVIAAGTTNRIEVTVTAVPGATSYTIYGRTGGSFLAIATITDPTVLYNDTGAATPSGASPTANFSASFRTPYAGHAATTGVLPGLTAGTYQKI